MTEYLVGEDGVPMTNVIEFPRDRIVRWPWQVELLQAKAARANAADARLRVVLGEPDYESRDLLAEAAALEFEGK